MGALKGLKILDFSTLLPGPFASLMLADMGADVLKISSASRPDLVINYEPFIEDTGISACHAWLGRNKKTMFLNLKTKEAKTIIKELVKEYDIVLEQFRPGVMDRLGLGYEELKKVNPGVIYCALTGYGQTGPLRDAAGHDINYLARSGIVSHAGRKADGPSLMNFQIADVAVGSMNSVIGILAAVHYRHMTGRGQFVDISMLDGCIPFNSLDGAGYLVSGRQPEREGEWLNGGCMYDYYKTRDEWTEVFSHYDACVQPVMNLEEALIKDEQIKDRKMVVDVPLPLHEEMSVRQMGTAIKLSESPCEYKFAGYPLGYHTREIIEKLGYNFEDLEEKGVFA